MDLDPRWRNPADTFAEQERIPFAEGFRTSEAVITAANISGLAEQVAAATPQ